MFIKNTNKGYMLLEMIIYVALFTIMIGGLIVTAFLLIQSGGKTSQRVVVQEEMNFVLKKIDWVLANTTSITSPNAGVTSGVLTLSDGTNTTTIEYDSVNKKILLNNEDLTTINVKVENLSFETIAGTPKGLEINLNIDGQTVSFIKYLKI